MCQAPSRCCRFSILAEGPENQQRPLGVLSRQATQRDGREAKTGKQSCLPFTELSSAKMSLGMEPQGKHLPLCPIISWVSYIKSLTLAFQLYTNPLPGGPGAWVICCFFKLAPHPWTVCQKGPLFMRIPRWLQLTLRCTILGLCPELFLVFFKAPSPS